MSFTEFGEREAGATSESGDIISAYLNYMFLSALPQCRKGKGATAEMQGTTR